MPGSSFGARGRPRQPMKERMEREMITAGERTARPMTTLAIENLEVADGELVVHEPQTRRNTPSPFCKSDSINTSG